MPISMKVERARILYAIRNCPTKVYQPEELIKKAIYRFNDNIAVGCSFGSCSVAVLHMALQIKPNIKVIFNNTGVEYPETIRYKELLKQLWNLNLIETKPIKSFWECVREYGFPLVRTTHSWKKRKTGSAKPECCIYLKEKPLAKACKEHKIKAMLTGLRCAESRLRMFTIAQRGMYYHTSTWGSLWRYHPIAFWTHQQVWDYLKRNNVPINEVYTKKKLERSGCMPCTGFIGWEQQLAKANLKMYRYIQKLRKVDLLDNYIQREDEIIDTCSPSEIIKRLE